MLGKWWGFIFNLFKRFIFNVILLLIKIEYVIDFI